MDKTEYLKRLNALNREFIKANRRLQDGEIIERRLPAQRFVVQKATGVNTTSGCEISYVTHELKADGTLGIKSFIYGYEWENYKATGQYWQDPDDDIL